MPFDRSERATLCATSLVMSITDSVGRAAAIEYGTSMLVMRARPRQSEVNVLTGDGDLLERRIAALGQIARDRLDELLRSRRAGGQPNRLVRGDQLVFE